MSVHVPDFPIRQQLIPFGRWLQTVGLKRNTGYAVLASGQVDTVLVGRLRMVVAASSDAYVQRLVAGQTRDPIEAQAAASKFKASVQHHHLTRYVVEHVIGRKRKSKKTVAKQFKPRLPRTVSVSPRDVSDGPPQVATSTRPRRSGKTTVD